jgi:hypothetical protein
MAGGFRGPYEIVFSFLENDPKHIVVWFSGQLLATTSEDLSIYLSYRNHSKPLNEQLVS